MAGYFLYRPPLYILLFTHSKIIFYVVHPIQFNAPSETFYGTIFVLSVSEMNLKVQSAPVGGPQYTSYIILDT